MSIEQCPLCGEEPELDEAGKEIPCRADVCPFGGDIDEPEELDFDEAVIEYFELLRKAGL